MADIAGDSPSISPETITFSNILTHILKYNLWSGFKVKSNTNWK
jgi:hypothetical protein